MDCQVPSLYQKGMRQTRENSRSMVSLSVVMGGGPTSVVSLRTPGTAGLHTNR